MATNVQTRKPSFFARAYHRTFHMGALRPHAKTLLPYFNSPGGRFVEIGAGDGIKSSFTPYLEKALGWKGLLVEPWPHLFQRCRKKRPQSVSLNVAAAEPLLTDSYIELQGKPPTASVRKSLLKEARERHEGKPIQPPIPGRQHKNRTINFVSTNSIAGILDRVAFDKEFDLIIFNLIGYEAQALDGMDFDRYRPTFVLIRADNAQGTLPGLPSYYQRIVASPHDEYTTYYLFRYADFGEN